MKQTLENIAVIRLTAAVVAMRAAADALGDVGGNDAALHAVELLGAATVASEWSKELQKAHNKAQRRSSAGA